MRARGKGGDLCVVGVGQTGKGGVHEFLEQVSSRLLCFSFQFKKKKKRLFHVYVNEKLIIYVI